jgi:hypothetical protein
MVAAEVQTLSTRNHTPSKQMQIIATGLLALNLASITGVNSQSSKAQTITDTEQRKSRIAQSEKLYNELITVTLSLSSVNCSKADFARLRKNRGCSLQVKVLRPILYSTR